MLKRLYDKSGILFALSWIAAYCILMSVGDLISESLKIEKSATLVVGALLCVSLFSFLKRYDIAKHHGLCAPRVSARSMLYYLPLLFMLTANFWCGAKVSCTGIEALLFVVTMLLVGFLEEVIFRGLLFGAMREHNPTAAVIVSSLSFGIGHILNLVNGSGAAVLSGLLQVVYATSAGFMFVMIYIRSESLVVCILSHGIFNALSIFANESEISVGMRISSCVLLTLITGSYAAYLALRGGAKECRKPHSK